MAICLSSSNVARQARLAAMGLLMGLGLCSTMAGFCVEVSDNVARSTIDGSVIDLTDVDTILADTALTEDQKREQLLALGVSEDLVEVLLASVQ